ncbi:right-handed parallel beta-helix repeat-containing protein [uncultured Psychroserpens sp.]|uniref:right-handed parallel beta-helix repeat-containing protein n=1 Tax=uncultured Psychroserpens sp. TaxID=255436 RepID=UPI0026181C6D|nr:right-handed parallel beta-helix repeat-containing protein [uncultured Psychroserpens sp.]
MKQSFAFVFIFFVGITIFAQQEFHVFPKAHTTTPGRASGDGSLENPWDLETALNQKPEVVNGHDIIWLHEGVYNGRYRSTVQSTIPNAYVTVSAYEEDKVTLNGNVKSKREAVLEVNGKQVIYKNFEITWLGDFSRFEADENFKIGRGLRHLKGANCKFYNLRIHDVPGLGFGFWKHGAGSIIEDCIIYNNGYVAKNGRGRGEGIYVQNSSDSTRLIKNSIIFNNYYKGIEVWSAGRRANFEYVKHIKLENNILFNNGLPSGRHLDNIIVASDDRNGINVAKHISVINNVLYHNSNFTKDEIRGDAPSLTLGFNKHAPIEDVIVKDNIIIGRSNGLRILQAKSLTFTNNIIHTGFVQFSWSAKDNANHWNFKNNTYYSRTNRPAFRIVKYKDFKFDEWQTTFNIDHKSTSRVVDDFDLHPVLAFNRYQLNLNTYNVALFDKKGNDVVVDVSKYGIEKGKHYKIYDAENPENVLSSGKVLENRQIVFPMNNNEFLMPLHNTKAQKTPSNFGVFIIDFVDSPKQVSKVANPENAFQHFLKWLGF